MDLITAMNDVSKDNLFFTLIVCFGACVAESVMECEWVSQGMGVFMARGNPQVAFHVDDFAGLRHSVISRGRR